MAQATGLNFQWGHGGKTPLHILETLGHGCAFLDFDQDGWLDILLVGNRRCALYRNTGAAPSKIQHPTTRTPRAIPVFEDVTARSGLTIEGDLMGVAVGDYDNDGFPDVYITGYGKCALYRNRGQSAQTHPASLFEDVTAKAGVGALGPYDNASAAAFADLDNDGRLDLFVGRYIVFTPETIRFCKFRDILAGCGIKNYDPAFPRVYRNLGNGAFQDVTQAWGFDKSHGRCLGVAVRAADDGSGVQLYVANDEQPGDLFVRRGARSINIGTSSGTAFNADGLTQGGMGVDWGDFNNDGKPDLIVATYQQEAKSLYRNDGKDTYTEMGGMMGIAAVTMEYVAWTARFFDFDNDGWSDLLFTNGHTQDNVHQIDPARSYPQPMVLFRNEEGRQFVSMGAAGGTAFERPIAGRGAAFGDFDNDGWVDVLIVNEEGPPLLLHNEAGNRGQGTGDRDTPTSAHWLGIKLVGKKSNRDGIGARVTVAAGGKTWVKDQQLAGGYISAHDPRLHFGLGTARTVDRVEVRWPSGLRSVVSRPGIDRYIEAREDG